MSIASCGIFLTSGEGGHGERQEDGAVRSPVAHFRVQASLKEGWAVRAGPSGNEASRFSLGTEWGLVRPETMGVLSFRPGVNRSSGRGPVMDWDSSRDAFCTGRALLSARPLLSQRSLMPLFWIIPTSKSTVLGGFFFPPSSLHFNFCSLFCLKITWWEMHEK